MAGEQWQSYLLQFPALDLAHVPGVEHPDVDSSCKHRSITEWDQEEKMACNQAAIVYVEYLNLRLPYRCEMKFFT